MSKPIKFPKRTAERMQVLLQQAKMAPELRRIQSVLLGAQGVSSLVICSVVGFTPEHIRYIWQQYRKQGEEFLLGEKRGQVRGRAHLPWQEEQAFLAPFIEEANAAGMLIVSEVHKAYEARYKREVYSSVIYNLLHRHGWRKIVPRPKHPQGDKERQAEYKALVFPPADYPSKD